MQLIWGGSWLVAATAAACLLSAVAHAQSLGDANASKVLADAARASNKTELDAALLMCIKKGCTPGSRASLYRARAKAFEAAGKKAEAAEDRRAAEALVPAPAAPSKPPAPAAVPPTSASAPPAASAEDAEDERSVDSPEHAVEEASAAARKGDYATCIAKDTEALAANDNARTRLHLAACQERDGKIVGALKSATKAQETASKTGDVVAKRVAAKRIRELTLRLPRVQFVPPKGVSDLSIEYDEKTVPITDLSKRFPTEPGTHKVVATGTLKGFPSFFEGEIVAKEGETVQVQLTLKPRDSVVTKDQIDCMLHSSSQEEVLACLPQDRKKLVFRAAGEASVYSDTTAVNVFTPSLRASVSSPTEGWNVGVNYTLDVLSAASPDIVSMASPYYRETRHAGGINGGLKVSDINLSSAANVSSEPDYLSLTGSLAASTDMAEKTITPRFGVRYSHDTIGRTGPSFATFSREFNTTELEGGITFVLSPYIVFTAGGTAGFERGDQSKPYRFVPLFSAETAGKINANPGKYEALKTADLDAQRLPFRALDQLPTTRDRFAVAARVLWRMGDSTLRLEERVYTDSWGLRASTTDARFMVDASKTLRLWPHVRFHTQEKADFYRMAYTGSVNAQGLVTLPTYRSTDRELGEMWTGTFGVGGRLGLGNPDGETRYAISAAVDGMYTAFTESLFVTSRKAVYATLALDVEF